MVGMASWSNTDAAMIGAAIGTVVLGVLVGRWWVLLVPIVFGALLALGSLFADPGDYHEGSPRSLGRVRRRGDGCHRRSC
jgi:hypothetical protein